MPTIHDTIILVTDLHRHQRDQAGQPYILHVLRVMLAMHTEAERLVALLHDVVEDGHLTLDDLRARGYAAAVVAAVDAISRRSDAGETYRAFIARAGQNPLAARVKLADLRDNLGRLDALPDRDRAASLHQRYTDAIRAITGGDGAQPQM